MNILLVDYESLTEGPGKIKVCSKEEQVSVR